VIGTVDAQARRVAHPRRAIDRGTDGPRPQQISTGGTAALAAFGALSTRVVARRHLVLKDEIATVGGDVRQRVRAVGGDASDLCAVQAHDEHPVVVGPLSIEEVLGEGNGTRVRREGRIEAAKAPCHRKRSTDERGSGPRA